jgi:hypothetical protein
MGFGSVIGSIELLQLVNTSENYAVSVLLSVLRTSSITIGHNRDSQSSLSVASERLPTADVPHPPGSPTVPGLSYQLLTATAHNT